MPQQQYEEDIVFDASEKARVDKKRQTEQRIRALLSQDGLRGTTHTELTSPRHLTINVPTGAAQDRQHRSVWPPQEIVLANPIEKPPKTIQVKGSFRPPEEIIVIENVIDGHVPNVIQVSDMLAVKQSTVVKSLSSTEGAVRGNANSSKHMRKEEPLFKGGVRTIEIQGGAPLRGKKDAPEQAVPEVIKGPKINRKEVPALGDEITVIKPSESSTTPLIPRQPTGPTGPDPPAAKASTTNRQILPDFSVLAEKKRHTRIHRKNILDESSNHNQLLHQSWPVAGRANTRKSQRARVPQWLGVTGTAEDWIKRDDPQHIGLKIASQRYEI